MDLTTIIVALISGGVGATIAAGVMNILQYKIKRKDTKEDAENQQSKDIEGLRSDYEKLKEDVERLKKHHKEDMEKAYQEQTEGLKDIKNELYVISHALLAALEGLKQQGNNANVNEALSMLSAHLNERAHK